MTEFLRLNRTQDGIISQPHAGRLAKPGPPGALLVRGRRDHPRLFLALPARVTLPYGRVLEGSTENLSCAGFQITGGPGEVACLFPITRQPGPRERQEAEVVLGGGGALPVPMGARCAAVFARRTAEAAWQLGFEFLDPEPALMEWLQARIASELRRSRDL